MKKVNLEEKFATFDAPWTPKIVGEVDDAYVKIFKARGEFTWHSHETEDEFFLVVKGVLTLRLRDQEVVLHPGEFFVVPKDPDCYPNLI